MSLREIKANGMLANGIRSSLANLLCGFLA